MGSSIFDQNDAVNQAKNEIADRKYDMKIKHMVITAGTAVAGALGGALLLPGNPMGDGMNLHGAIIGGGLGLSAGGALAELVTMKEKEKLKIDEELLASRTQGKNYWGGYREEVMEGGRTENLPLPLMARRNSPQRA